MRRKLFVYSVLAFLCLLFSACSPAPNPEISYDPQALRFSGERAYALVEEFVLQFPYRHSNQPNNHLAAQWLEEQFTSYGLDCQIDTWQVINYSELWDMQNVICRLPGESSKEIIITAHLDQSPDTIYGADNDGSGIGILLHLAEIFAAEPAPRYTLVFLATDGEEYGMLGTKRFVDTHPDTGNIIAGMSLDNLGKYFYYNLGMYPRGQFRNYGPVWLQRTTQEAARAADDLWVPTIRAPIDQVMDQAVPVSFMDQGPMVAAGIPAFGFAGLVPADKMEEHDKTYHTPLDTMELQSPDVLYQSGRIPEALIRQLLTMENFPEESGPYFYLEGSNSVFRGLPLWAIFIGFVGVFFGTAYLVGGRLDAGKLAGWRKALPHLLSLWLPLLATIVLTYLMVAVGLMDKYAMYPATPKDEPLYNPRWPAVILFLAGLVLFLYVGRRLARRYSGARSELRFGQIKSLAFFVIGLGALYILVINPFSLLFLVPLLFWLLIGGRSGFGKVLDVMFFLLGGLVVYALVYFFGFVILKNDFAVLWYMLMMFSIQEISFFTASVITAIVGAGLSMIVNPPQS